ncbi:hypothetical protein PybrP1_012765 [[Pythium] brassicae (nom. inval.)]|nr:hypothetical protein PybrP1_012765 [[Pythium] brassicae (nom. inval.)]
MTVLLPTSVANANWFLLAGVWAPLAAAAALLHPTWRALPLLLPLAPRRVPVLWSLLFVSALSLVLGVALEVYYSRACANSAVFHREIEDLARFVYRLCARSGVSSWVMFGNLLFVLRGQSGIPVGDTDSDVGVPKRAFLDAFQSVSNFSAVARRDAYLELQRVVFVVYHPERELVQLYLDEAKRGSHADIWLYKEEVDPASRARWLVNADRTIRAKRLPYEHVLPLRDEPAWFLGARVGVPRNASLLAQAEYGEAFMTPMVTRMECVENVLNGYTFYQEGAAKRRHFALFLLAASALALAVAYVVPALNQVLVTPGKSAHPWVHTREKDYV